MQKKIDIPIDVTAETKCSYCPDSRCCTYVTQQLDKPRSKDDFRLLLWQVSHQNVEVYKDSDGWFLLFNGSCEHLEADGKCAIYETRPPICRDHTNDHCELDSPAEEGFDLYFTNYEQLLKYCRKRFKKWDKKKKEKKS
ncbi:MAG: YkgJ family cysteine cluster protein [Gammaproteobacteria bacterium]|nr:YkgJ family cysteine cluster protein [Gammaproteobacteria bacterium]